MGTLGTFDSFTTARLGIYAAQHGLRVTGNNISNINTSGYTRQRVDQVSFKTGGSDRYASFLDRHIGTGALISGISQIRDPYLDIRYRTSSADTSYYDTKLRGLQEIASILDEVGKGGSSADGTEGDGLLYAQLRELKSQLLAYGANPTSGNDTLVRSAAETLTMMFQDYASRLEQVRKDTVVDLGNNVDAVNGILTNIRSLNKSIREAEIHGDKALELRDERNRQIDDLSKYMHIKVEYTMEDVGAGIEVEKLTIYLGNANPDPKVETDSSVLVDGLYATQISIPEQKPVLNRYFGSNTPPYDLLKDYLYLQEHHVDNIADAPAGSVLQVDENGDPIKDENGKLVCLVGTNVVDEATPVENDNYTIQLGKLLDEKGIEWKNSKTTWTDVSVPVDTNAIFQIPVSGKNLVDQSTFSVKGTLHTVGGDVTLAQVQDPAQFAAIVAADLQASGAYPDYDVTSDANGNIVFTAKAGKEGEIGKNGPAAWPSLSVNDPDDTGWITAGNMACTNPGVKYELPANPQPPAGTETDPVTGDTVTTAYTEVDGKQYRITVETKHTREVALDDNDLRGSLQAQRELLTEEGEFSSEKDVAIDENAKTKRGIPYYQKSFDLLAQQIAKHFNELNQGYMLNQKGNYVNEKGAELTIAGEPISKYNGLTDAQKEALAKANLTLDEWLENSSKLQDGAVKMGGPLFSNSNDGDDTTGINASNIDVSHSWSSRAIQVVPKFEVLFPGDEEPDGSLNHTTQVVNVNHMISLIDKELVYDPRDIDPEAIGANLFTGSFNDMFCNMMGVQGDDAKETNVMLNNSYTTLVSLDSSREGVSGVDLNDEAMNMMQYQKAMNAAMRLMTAIDEALDRLINNTGIAGR